MKKFVLLLSTLALAFTLVSCQKELKDVRTAGVHTYSVEAADWDNANEFSAKSFYFSDYDQKVHDCNVWVYEAGVEDGGAVNTQSYFETLKNIDASKLFPDPYKSYDFFMLANVGNIAPPATLAGAKAYRHVFDLVTEFYGKHFPMASSYYNFCPADPNVSGTLLVKKLVSRYNVKFDFTNNDKNDYDFVLSSAAIKNSAKVIYPYAQVNGVEQSVAADAKEVVETADILSEADIIAAQSGSGVDLYMIENVIGEAFSGEYVRTKKYLRDEDQERATYIEFTGSLDKRDGTGYHNVILRYYFGKDTRVEVKRNYITEVQLNLKNSILDGDDEWSIEPEDPYNNSWVDFVPSSLTITGNGTFSPFYTTTGINEEAGDATRVKYYLDYNSADYSAAGLTLQYSKTENGSYSNYTKGTELTGPYHFKVKSTYTGSTQKTVNIEAYLVNGLTGETELSNTLPMAVNPFTGPFTCDTFYLWDNSSYLPYYDWRRIESDEDGTYLWIYVNRFLNNFNEISQGKDDSYFGWKMRDDFLPGEQLMWKFENFDGLDMGGNYYNYLNTQWDENYRGNRYVFSELKQVLEATINSATATNNITNFVDYGSDDSGNIEVQSRIKFDFSEVCGRVTLESVDSNPIFIKDVNISNAVEYISLITSGGVGIFDKQNDPDVAEQQLDGKYLTLSINTNINSIQQINTNMPSPYSSLDSSIISFDSHNDKVIIKISLKHLYEYIYSMANYYGPYDSQYEVYTQWQGRYTSSKCVKLIEINMP